MRTPGPWTARRRQDGLYNAYAGNTDVALCIRPDDARMIIAAPDMLDLIKRSAHLLAESAEATDRRVLAHRNHLVALIKELDPEYYGG